MQKGIHSIHNKRRDIQHYYKNSYHSRNNKYIKQFQAKAFPNTAVQSTPTPKIILASIALSMLTNLYVLWGQHSKLLENRKAVARYFRVKFIKY